MPWAAAGAVLSAGIGAAASRSASKRAQAASDASAEATATQTEIAKDQWDSYKNTFQPLEQSLAAEARQAGSAAEYEKAVGAAGATVQNQLGLARDRLARTPGMDPSSPAAQAAIAELELKGAALGAGEQNRARKEVANQAFAKKLDAIGIGKGVVSNATSGMASAASSSAAMARNASAEAGQTASSVGSLVGGVSSALQKTDWSKVGNFFGFGATPTTT